MSAACLEGLSFASVMMKRSSLSLLRSAAASMPCSMATRQGFDRLALEKPMT